MKSKLGQYFTTNIILKEKIHEFILNNPKYILEPSVGRGDIVMFILEKNPDIIFDMYEIDKSIELLKGMRETDINYTDFIQFSIVKKYTTIIGNPPYIKTRTSNLYIDFIKKCYELLEIKGELIFIIPSDFFKLTGASKLINNMMENGTFTHIFHPHDEKMFDNASIDIIIFRYCKDTQLDKKVMYNNENLFITNNNGMITFDKIKNTNKKIFKDYFDIYVGIVSGKDAIYKNKDFGNIEVLNGENKFDKYIHITKYPSENILLNNYLDNNKECLMKRRIKKFNESNWFEWGAPRNISIMNKFKGEDCIYIYNLTRQKTIAFTGKIGFFGGNLLMLKPKGELDLNSVCLYLNSEEFKNNFIFSGRFKIGHRQISNSSITI
jgi:adenine-specific DNA-methyltransferase